MAPHNPGVAAPNPAADRGGRQRNTASESHRSFQRLLFPKLAWSKGDLIGLTRTGQVKGLARQVPRCAVVKITEFTLADSIRISGLASA